MILRVVAGLSIVLDQAGVRVPHYILAGFSQGVHGNANVIKQLIGDLQFSSAKFMLGSNIGLVMVEEKPSSTDESIRN